MSDQQTQFQQHFEMKIGQNRGPGFGFWFGIAMVIIGGGLLLDAFNLLEFGEIFDQWWPSLLMLIAVAQLATGSGSIVGSGIMFTIGALLQLSKLEYLPGGYLDTSKAQYCEVGRGTRVTGSRWETTNPYTVKLEAVVSRGFRSTCLAGVRDPYLLACLDGVLEKIRASVARQIGSPEEVGYQLQFRVYGSNAVMGSWEPSPAIDGHEVGVLIDVVAATQEKASYVCSMARGDLHMNDYPGRKSTAGNVALAFSPSEVEMGETFGFHIWHLLPLDNPLEPFRTTVREFDGKGK